MRDLRRPYNLREIAEQPSPDGTHNEPEREEEGRVQLLDDGIVTRKKRAREIQCEGRVSVKIVPLHQVASQESRPRSPSRAAACRRDRAVRCPGWSPMMPLQIPCTTNAARSATNAAIHHYPKPGRRVRWPETPSPPVMPFLDQGGFASVIVPWLSHVLQRTGMR